MDVLTLDGSYGEGGGQILRTALSLSTITTRPFRLANIRAGRRNPGLLPQHLSAVHAAAAISGAILSGDRLGLSELCFAPSLLPSAGSYVFDVTQAAEGGRSLRNDQGGAWPRAIHAFERGALQRITGRSVAANLPAHIPQRMADRARTSLEDLRVPVDIQPQRVTAACPGAGIFLLADYEPLKASFPPMAGWGGRPKALPTKRLARCASITHRQPPSNSTSPTSCSCRFRLLPVPPNSRLHARPDI